MRSTLSNVARLSLTLLISIVSSWPIAAQPTASLRIVVIEGEDAVNIIQQNTAVAPVVEVRDRNDQPVAGAVVNFAIRSGRATFGGARTLTVTTNAAGRAVAAGFAPTGTGALQIGATATVPGQAAATVTIAQTTVQTAAQAAAVSGAGGGAGAGGSGSGAAGAGAGGGAGGGGLSATTIGVLGGAAAGGIVAARELGPSGGGTKYSGQFSGTLQMRFSGTCFRDELQTGTLEVEVSESNGSISGNAHLEGSIVFGNYSCGPPTPGAPQPGSRDSFGTDSAPLSGGPGSITFTKNESNRFPASGNASAGTNAYTYSFVGALNGAEIAGDLTITRTITDDSNPNNPGTGTITHRVTLR